MLFEQVKVANAAVVYITPYLMKWSTPGTLLFFGVLNVLNALFVVVYIKETFPLFVSPPFLVAESFAKWIFSFKGLDVCWCKKNCCLQHWIQILLCWIR